MNVNMLINELLGNNLPWYGNPSQSPRHLRVRACVPGRKGIKRELLSNMWINDDLVAYMYIYGIYIIKILFY